MFSHDFRSHGEKAIYGPPIALRILCGIFLFFLLVGFFSVLSSDEWTTLGIFPVIVIIVFALCLLYRDSWIFDNEERRVVYIWGIGPFVKRESWSYDDIERIEVTHFIKGIPETSEKQVSSWKHRAQVVLAVRFDRDTKKDLEIMGEKKSGGKLERNASWLSGFTGLALFVDRPRETKTSIR